MKPTQKSGHKVIVLGIDGGTWDIILPMAEEGRLPHFSRLMDQGVWGKLDSTIPPDSPPAWTSFMTGKNPGKHGVFYFLTPPDDHYRRVLTNSTCIRASTVWEILGRVGKRSIVINVPITYPPPHEMEGVMIAGIPIPSEEVTFTCPDWIYPELLVEIGDYPLEDRTIRAFRRGEAIGAVKELYYMTKKHRQAAFYLMEHYPWDLFVFVIRGTDLVQHICWRFWDETYRRSHPDETAKLGELIPQYYVRVDQILGEFMDRVEEEMTLVVMSDHGAGPVRKLISFNNWLYSRGWFQPRGSQEESVYRRVFGWTSLGRRYRRFSGRGLIGRTVGRVRLPTMRLRSIPPWQRVDWSRTKAYASFTGGEPIICINLKGREEQGIVEPGREYEELRDQIIDGLFTLTDPDTGDPVVERVYRREEIYSGPYLEMAPDLQVMTVDRAYLASKPLPLETIMITPSNASPGVHRYHGILGMIGPLVANGYHVTGARIIDVAPTILHLLGAAVPEDMDGEVLTHALDEDYLRKHPVQSGPPVNGGEGSGITRRVFSEAETQRIEESLRGLGYM